MDRRSITSKLNGKKGGRKKGVATIEREKAKEYIAERIGEYMPAIFDVMIVKALDGDITAIKELFDRGFGKALQAVDVGIKDNRTPPLTPDELKAIKEVEDKLASKAKK